jgi:sugar-specific transcriptional regulator TrmB
MRIEVDLKRLQELGLTERESKVYCALISREPILMTEISSATSMRQSKVSETLHRLLQLGLVIVRPVGRKKFYEAVRPDDAVQHLLLRNEKEMERRRQTAAQLEQQLMSVYNASRGAPSAQDSIGNLVVCQRALCDRHQRPRSGIAGAAPRGAIPRNL